MFQKPRLAVRNSLVMANRNEDIDEVNAAAHAVLAAAEAFQVKASQVAVDAYTEGAVGNLEAATEVVRVSTAAQEVVDAAQNFRDLAWHDPVDAGTVVDAAGRVRAATNRILHVVKVRAAATEVLVAAKKFRGLAIQDPVVSANDQAVLIEDQAASVKDQAAAVEEVRAAISKVPTPVPKVRGAADVVLDAAQKFREFAFGDDVVASTVQVELKKVLKATKKVSAAVDEDQQVPAYKVAANLTKIFENAKYKLHRTALQDWQRREKDLFDKVSRRQTRSADLTNQIYNIIGWFAVFQGVVLTAVSQLTQTAGGKPLCGKIWFPIVLTGFGAVVTVGGIVHKFRGLKSLELTINTEKQAQIVCSCFPSTCSSLFKARLHCKYKEQNSFCCLKLIENVF